jgi:hypothetical protein
MTLEQAILDAVRALAADKQRELLDYVEGLSDEATQPRKLRIVSLSGSRQCSICCRHHTDTARSLIERASPRHSGG